MSQRGSVSSLPLVMSGTTDEVVVTATSGSYVVKVGTYLLGRARQWLSEHEVGHIGTK